MIEWYRNRKRIARLFRTKQDRKDFIDKYTNRGMVIKQVEAIKRNIEQNNQKEIDNRSKYINQYGMLPPKTIAECNQMIKDLVTWRS